MIAALALAACGGEGAPGGDAVSTAPSGAVAARPALELVSGEGMTFGFARLPPGQYLAYGTSTGAVHEPVTVIDVQPLTQSGAVSFVGARVAFYACQPQCRSRPGYWGSRLLMGGMCAPVVPASRAVYDAVGMELFPGDAPIFILVLRMDGAAEASARGIRVTYQVGSERRVVESRVNSVAVATDEAPPAGQCGDPKRDPWLGGSQAEKYLVEL